MKPKSVKTRVVVGEIVRLRIELEIGVLSETVMIEQPVPPTEPTWNSWFEESGDNPTFEPLARLAPNSAYTFVLDLAAFEYDGSNAGGRSRADVRVRDWLGRSPRDLPSLTVVVVPDSSLLRIVGQHGRPLQVDRARMRNYMARNREIPVDALAELKKNPKAPFDFGSVRFPIATGSRTGRVRLAVWILGDGITPLDEMSVDACIGSDREAGSECASDRLSVQDADDLIDGRSLAKDPDPPAAALNFIDFDGERGAGMFRVRNWPAGEY
jgi:hypothetical protein